MLRHLYQIVVLTLLVPAGLAAQTSVTLFQDGRVLVRRAVPATLPRGESVHRFPLGELDPATVFSLDSAVRILRVSYDAATDEQNTLRRMVGRTMLFHRGYVRPGNADTVRAEILRVDPALYRLADGTVTFQQPGTPVYPADVIQVAPTTELGVSTTRARQDLPLGFFSNGANWSAVYTVLIDRGRARVSGVASVMSQSFTADSADLQLLAGEVGRAPTPLAREQFAMDQIRGLNSVSGRQVGTTEESVGDVHLYTLGGRHTLRPGVTTTIPLFEPATTTSEKVFTIPGSVTWRGVLPQMGDETVTPVLVTYVLRRPRRTPFGDLPIPGGVARIYEPDAAGRPQLIGESSFAHTAAGQDLRLGAGQAFDLTARRVQTAYRTERDSSRTRAFADYRVTVANAADSAATVEVLERRSGEWTVLSSSVPAERLSSTETRFRLRVPAGGEAVLTYRVRVTW